MNLQIPPIVAAAAGKRLVWDVDKDLAVLTADGPQASDGNLRKVIWSGSLLPAFELETDGGANYVKAAVSAMKTTPETGEFRFALDFGAYGSGSLLGETTDWGLRFTRLETNWTKETRIVSFHFGTRLMTQVELSRAPRLDRPFWSDWSSEGYCVPVAGSSPTHSFFRSWDMGDATLPLGSFGDAMGTPYAAAFPRPLYAAAMGGRHGWLAFGPGEIPDASMTLHLQSVTASLRYAYREDLWSAPDLRNRQWIEPLRLAWGDTGYEAFGRLYETFGPFEQKSPHHARSFICTWGDFKEGRFDLKQFERRVSRTTPADMVIIDDCWESFVGSGEPHLERFPNFEADLDRLRERGYEIAIWQSLGWTDDPAASGLTEEDLLCGPDGTPRQWRWSGNPLAEGGYHYLLDPSSERTRKLIVERVRRIMHRWRPAALKLDFGYGFPSQDVCVPRDPAYRGERLAYALLKLTCEAAKSVDPAVTLIYYGINPLLRDVTDLINLDDLGDAGDSAAHEIAGHNQRCLWASLAAAHGMPVNTSTGYYWDTLGPILLDTAVVGVNGLTIGEFDVDGKRITAADQARWIALQTWHRRTCGWKPLWLDADTGSLQGEPKLISWGRLEATSEGDTTASAATTAAEAALTALALRNNDGAEAKRYEQAPYLRFTGQWAILSQDGLDLKISKRFVCIPFSAGTLAIDGEFSGVQAYGAVDGRLTPLDAESAFSSGPPELRLEVSDGELSKLAGFEIQRQSLTLLSTSVSSGNVEYGLSK
ncbi:hypothetical protein [Cohnella sp.]|uniref:hypothetical protein n=1 Tax=Cohnella sp. TaxID=1883426 RepID=UPI003568A900